MTQLHACARAALAIALAGCSALFTYPEVVDEANADVCTDGRDNDFDGQIDCFDLGCSNTSACTLSEQSLDECDDGRDNDEDGFIDRADPLCWRLHDDPWVRCRRTRSATVAEQFDGSLAGRWYESAGRTPILGDPPPRPGRSDLAVELRPDQRIFPRATVSSPQGELRTSASVNIPVGATLQLEVWRADLSGPEGQDVARGRLGILSLQRGDGVLIVVLERGSQRTEPMRIDPPETDWFDVSFRVSCGTALSVSIGDVELSDQTAGTCYVRSTSPRYRPPGSMARNEVRLGIFATGSAWVDDVLFESLGAESCGTRLPRFDEDPDARPLPTDAQILSIATNAQVLSTRTGSCFTPPRPTLCALVLDRDQGTVEPWRSTGALPDGTGLRIGLQLIRAAPLPATRQVQSASVEWVWTERCDERRWRATVRTGADDDARFEVFESTDCQTWEPVEHTLGQLDESDGWRWHGYAIRSAQQDQRIGPRQELYAAQLGEFGLFFGRGFQQDNTLWTGIRTLNDRNVAQLAELDFPISLSRVGSTDQLLVANVRDQGLRVHVIPPGTLGEALGWQSGLGAFEYVAQFDPSGLPGTTDRWDVESAVATVALEDDGNPFGFALFAARGDYGGPPDSEAVSFGIACRQISRFDTPCELPDPSVNRDLEPRCNDGLCFDSETCETCPGDCGNECADGLDDENGDGEPDITGPLDLSDMQSSEPELAHASSRGNFVWTRPSDGARAFLPLDPTAPRNTLHFDVLLDGQDGCAVQIGLGDDAVTPAGDAVGELAELSIVGDRVEYRALTRNAAGTEVVSDDAEDDEFTSNRARWQHVIVRRNEFPDAPTELAVIARELDFGEAAQVRARVPSVVTSRTRLFVEIPPFGGECSGLIRNVFVD